MPVEKPIYRLIDCKGRVHLPKALRDASGLECGGFVRLLPSKGGILMRKVELIEVGDQSPEAVEAFVNAAINQMSSHKRLEMAARLLDLEKELL